MVAKNFKILLLLLVLSVTDAYLLNHPNIIGKLGVLLYRHDYIRTFPRALVMVLSVVVLSIVAGEVSCRLLSRKWAILLNGLFLMVSFCWFFYVNHVFRTFTYRFTGKSFIYGVHLLPLMIGAIFGWYVTKSIANTWANTDRTSPASNS